MSLGLRRIGAKIMCIVAAASEAEPTGLQTCQHNSKEIPN